MNVKKTTILTSVFLVVISLAVAQQQAPKMPDAKERERLKQVDPPIKPDPLGNGLIGGIVGGQQLEQCGGPRRRSIWSCLRCCEKYGYRNSYWSRNGNYEGRQECL